VIDRRNISMEEENKFKKDTADPQANVKKLDEIFEVDTETGEILNVEEAQTEIREIKKELKEIEDSLPDIDNIILSNIERANRFLDVLEDQVIRGNLSAGMVEACATLINAVTSAATSITGISYNNEVLEIRKGELQLREKKLAIEGIASGAKNVNITNNNLTMTREELLKELQNSQQPKEIE
jgi:hypothetical protein